MFLDTDSGVVPNQKQGAKPRRRGKFLFGKDDMSVITC
jgi:hypothetical protein